MSLWCRTRGRQNSGVIQIHLSLSLGFPPSFPPSFPLFLRCSRSWVLSASWGADSLPEATKHSPFIKSTSLSSEGQDAAWTNELSERYERACRFSVHKGGDLYCYRSSQHIKHTCVIFECRKDSPPPPGPCACVSLFLMWKHSTRNHIARMNVNWRYQVWCLLVSAAEIRATQVDLFLFFSEKLPAGSEIL